MDGGRALLLARAHAGKERMNLVCMIASVIRDARRLRYFRMLLDSIRAQSVPPHEIWLSLHIDPSVLSQEDWDPLLSNLPGRVRILRQRRPKRQFVQYGELLERLKDTPETFIMFSDDDDLWHPDRALTYYHAYWQSNPDQLLDCASFVAREETMHPSRPCARCQRDNEANVQAMLDCGCLTFRFVPYDPAERVTDLFEYHEYVVRPHVLRDFLSEHATLVETNRFADMQFRRFVVKAGLTGVIVPSHWLYYYRRCDTGYAAVTNLPFDMPKSGNVKDIPQSVIDAVVEYYIEMAECPAMGPKRAAEGISAYVKADRTLGARIFATFAAAKALQEANKRKVH